MNTGLCRRILKSNLLEDDKIVLIKLIGLYEHSKSFEINTIDNEPYTKSDEMIDEHLMNVQTAEEALKQFDSEIDRITKDIFNKTKSNLKGEDLDDTKNNIIRELNKLLISALDERITDPTLTTIKKESENLKIMVSDFNDGNFQLTIMPK